MYGEYMHKGSYMSQMYITRVIFAFKVYINGHVSVSKIYKKVIFAYVQRSYLTINGRYDPRCILEWEI